MIFFLLGFISLLFTDWAKKIINTKKRNHKEQHVQMIGASSQIDAFR